MNDQPDLTIFRYWHHSCKEATIYLLYIATYNAVRSLFLKHLLVLEVQNKDQLKGQNHLKFEGKLGSKAVKPNCLDP